jgi:hypothetical protein
VSNRSKTQRPPARSSRSSSREPVLRRVTIGTASGEVPTELPPEVKAQLEGQILSSMAANIQGDQPEPRPWATAEELEQVAGLPDGFDPDLAFGLPQEDPLQPGASLDGDGWDSGEATKQAGSTASSPAVGNPLVERRKAAAFGQLAAAAFAALSGLLNARLRLDEDDETWLAEKEDLDGVGKPAGRIIARHAPLPGGSEANDLGDAIEIVIAGAGYLIKNATARAKELRERRRAAVPVYQEG